MASPDSEFTVYLPQEIAQAIVEESLPWPECESLSIVEFLQQFTLHDSHWIGMHLDSAWGGDATAIISFDPIWNQVGVEPTARCADWPTLLIRFPRVSAINISGYKDIGGIQRGIAGATTEVICPSIARTEIADHYGGLISVHHDIEVKFLCYSASGKRIALRDTPETPL